MKITPELIPHAEFHTGSWLLSVDRPEWYYFRKKRNKHVVESKDFLKSVDKPLRRLVKWLHARGISTTPSCSGHHIRERVLEQVYDALERDAEEIRNGGLQVKDIETEEIQTYRNMRYTLPWTREEFIEQVGTYQQKGVLGLRLGNHKKAKEALCRLNIAGAKIVQEGPIVFIFTSGEDTSGDNTKVWRRVTRAVKRVLNETLP
jgi:hypothetical protein